MKVGNAMVVEFDYSVKTEDGEFSDTSEGNHPMVYLHGCGNTIEGLEDALEGLTEGDSFEVSIPAKKAYGEIDKRLIKTIDRSQFPENAVIEIGSIFTNKGADGHTQFRVSNIVDDKITIDSNHHLAGKTLLFTGKIISIREGTQVELTHGHVHGPGGHHH